MKIDFLVFQLAVIFLPGLIWARLDARYALNAKPSDLEFLIRAFIFGLTSYAVTYLLYAAAGFPFTLVSFENADTKPILTAAVAREVFAALIVGIVLGILWIYSATYKWLTRFLQKIKATKTYGDEDVWDYTFNSPIAAVEYVNYRDFDNKIVYAGYVSTYSETDKLRELVLRDVQIYDFDGNFMFAVPLLYLARKPESIHIEFPYSGLPTKEGIENAT